MAIAFELSATFGSRQDDAVRFASICERRFTDVRIGGHLVSFHPPIVSHSRDAGGVTFVVSVLPKCIGYHVGYDVGPRIALDEQELSTLGVAMYDAIRESGDFELARVGWDVDWLCVAEIVTEWRDEIVDGSLHGFVISDAVRPRIPMSDHFERFDSLHSWIPYRGTRAV